MLSLHDPMPAKTANLKIGLKTRFAPCTTGWKTIMSFALRFPFSGIVSRQPARTTLRFRSESAADASASGVRSGTQPTVMVAKGK